MSFWIVASIVADLHARVWPRGSGLTGLAGRFARIPKAVVGMLIAHLGVAVFCFGVVMVRSYEVEKDVQMEVGDSTALQGYTFTFMGTRELEGPNYSALQGRVQVTQGDGKRVREMFPESAFTASSKTR